MLFSLAALRKKMANALNAMLNLIFFKLIFGTIICFFPHITNISYCQEIKLAFFLQFIHTNLIIFLHKSIQNGLQIIKILIKTLFFFLIFIFFLRNSLLKKVLQVNFLSIIFAFFTLYHITQTRPTFTTRYSLFNTLNWFF